MEFEWDAAKEAQNLAKHGISFVVGARVLSSGDAYEFESNRSNEPRWVAIGGHPDTGRVIAVVYAKRGDIRRIISVRRARQDEEEAYRTRRASEATDAELGPQARQDEGGGPQSREGQD
jgi:uncharacterized protein